jgi:hypothetical protein
MTPPVQEYSWIQTIFSYSLATDKFAMDSSEPLGTPSTDYIETQESKTVFLDATKDDDHILVACVGLGACWI